MVAAALLGVAVSSTPKAQAANLTWNQTGAGPYSWTDSANWGGTGFPNAIGDVANLSGALAGAQTVNLNAVITLGELNFGATEPSSLAGYTLAGGTNGLLILDDTDGAVSINKLNGSPSLDTISADIQFNDALTISNNSGGGTLTLGTMRSVASDVTLTGTGVVAAGSIVTGAISTAGSLIKEGVGVTQMAVNTTYAGTTWVKAGRLIANSGSSIPIRSAITIDAGAVLESKQNAMTWGSIAGAGNVTIISGTRNITIGRDDTSTSFSGTITSTTPSGLSITKIGAGTLTLAPSGANASTYTGLTTVSGGKITLDTSASSLTSGFLAGTALTLGGGAFEMIGRSGATTTQTLGNLIMSGAGVITVTANGGTATNLRFGTFTNTAAGSTLLVTAPTNTVVSNITTALTNNILGAGRSVFSDGAGALNWLSQGSTTPFQWTGLGTGVGTTPAYTGALPADGSGVATGNYTLSGSQLQSTAASTINTLKITSTGASQSLDLAGFNLTASGYLVTGTDAYEIKGTGALTAATDLVIHQFNSGGLTINAPLSGAGALTKTGTGVLTLGTGANAMTGAITINAGVLSFSSVTSGAAGSLGAGLTTVVSIRDGGTLRYTGASGTIIATAATAGAHTYNLTGGNATIEVTGAAATLTLAGVMSGAGGLTIKGPGILTLSGANTYTGPTNILSGATAKAGVAAATTASGALGSLSPTTVGGTLDINALDTTIGSLAGAGIITNSASTAKTLTLGGANLSTTFTGSFTNGTATTAQAFTKNGTGILIFAGSTTSTWTGNHQVNGGVLRLAASNLLAATVPMYVANGSAPALLELSSGVSQSVGALSFGGTGGATSGQGTVLIGSTATLTLGGNVTYTTTGNPLPAYVSGAGGLALSATRTFTIGDSTSVGALAPELTVAVPITGSFGITKTGFGNLLLSGANTFSGDVTTLTAGGLILDYTTQNNSKISGVNSLALNGGGNLTLLGNASADTSQTVFATTLASGGFSTMRLTPGGSQKILLNLGAFTRATSAGTIRFSLPTGAQDATNGFRTTTSNVNGILGGWATATNVSGVTNFAANDGSGGIVLVTSATKADVTTWALADHVSDGTSGYSGILAQNLGVSSLRFDSAADSTVTIADGRVLTISSGGVLQTSAASGSIISPTVAGGRLVSGAGNELIFTTDVTTPSRPLVVSSAIGGAQILTKTGNGILKLSSANNDFTGVTYLKAGTLQVQGGNAIGDSSLVNFSTTRTSVFELLANETIGGILGGNSAQGGSSTIALAGNTLRIIQSSDQTYSGLFSGTGKLVKDGPSALNLNINSSATFTFPLQIVGGQFRLSGNDTGSGRIGSTVITVANPGSQLHINQDNNNSPDRIVDTAVITLNNTAPGLGLFFRDSENAGSNSETIGSVILGAGHNVIAADYTGGTATRFGTLTLSAAAGNAIGRTNNATTLVVGRNLGSIAYGSVLIADTGGRIVITTVPTGVTAPVGGAGADGTTTASIFPYMIGQATTGAPTAADVGNSFVRHTSGRLRPLSTATGVDAEYIFDAPGFNLLADSTASNVRFTATPGATLNAASATTRTVNALAIDSSSGAVTVTGPGTDNLVLTSGALLSTGAAANNTALTGFAGITTGTNNEYIVYVTNNQFTLGSPLTTSAAALTKSGAGVLVLNGLTGNTYTGGTFFNQGLIEASTLADLGPSGSLNFYGGGLRWATGATFDLSARQLLFGTGGATLDTNGNNVTFLDFNNVIGSGALTKDGAGVLTLNPSVTGILSTVWATNVNAGTLALGASGAIGTGDLALTNNGVLALGAGTGAANQTVSQLSGASTSSIVGGDAAASVLTVNQSTTSTFAGAIGGVGANQNNLGLTKSGVGSLTLTGATLSYAGPTVVSAGILNLAGSTGAALATSAITVARGAALNFVNTAGQAINLGSGVLTLGASGTGSTVLGLELGSLAAYDRITSSAAAVVSGEVVLNLSSLSGSQAGDYDLLTAASGLTSAGATYILGSLTVAGGARTFSASDTLVRLSVTAFTSDLYWSNALGGGNWSENNGLTSNFATDLAGTNANGLPGVNDRVIFSANTAGGPTIATILNGNFNIKDLEFAANPSGVTSVSIAPGTLTPGILTLTPAVATDGIDVAANAGFITISAPVGLGANQRWAVDGTGLNGSSLTVSGAITGAFNLEKTGAGILTLAVAGSSYSGTTTVADGVLQAGIAQGFSNASAHTVSAGAILRLNAFSATIGSLAGAGTVENGGAANVTLTAGGDNSSTTFSGTLQNGATATLALTKVGNGALTLSGANTNTGNFTVNGGRLSMVTGTTTMSAGQFTTGSAANTRGMLLIGSGASITTVDLDFGSNAAAAAGAGYQTGGTVVLTAADANGVFGLGNANTAFGYYEISGGSVTMNRLTLSTPSTSGSGIFRQTGGTVNIGTWTTIGHGTGTSLLDLAGGVYNSGTNFAMGVDNAGSTSVVNVRGSAVFIAATGSTISLNRGDNAARDNMTNALNLLTGGTIRSASGGITNGTTTGATNNFVQLNLNGGTIITNQATANLININNTNATLTANSGAFVFAGGLTVDTNGLNSTIPSPLQAPAGLGVQSIAISTEGTGYIGAPGVRITGGTGSGATAMADMVDDGSGNGTFKIGSLTITNPGTGYLGTDTLTVSFVDNASVYGTQATLAAVTFNAGNVSGGLTKIGAGTLTLSGANTYAGGTNVNNGTLALGANNVLADAGNVTIAGGTLDVATFNDTVATVSLRGGVITGTTGVLTSTAAFDLRDGSVDAILAGSVGLNKTTAATVTLSKANTYSGVTNITGGTLVFSAANQLGNASATNTLTLNGGTLSYTGSGTANLVANQGMTIGSSGATLNTSDATGILNLQGGIVTSAAANLTKTGLGAVTVGLGGSTNLNGGNVTVSAGVLNAGFTASGLGAIAVSTGATLNLYDGSTSTMAVTGLTLAAGSSLGFDLGATGVNDVLNLTGTAAITPSVSLNFNALGTLGAGSYSLLSVSTGTLNAADYVLGLAPSGLNYNFTTINAGQTLQLTTSLLNLVYWKGDVGGSWSSNNAGDTNWASDLAGTTDLAALPIATDTLVFAATSAVGPTFTTTLDGSFAADSLKFTANPVGVTAVAVNQGSSGTLTLSPASANNGISVPANVGAITIGAPIATGAIQTWEVVGGGANGSSLTVSGAVTIGHVINKTGAGVLTLSGSNTGSGGLVLAAGTLIIGNNNALGAGTFSIGAGTTVDTGATAIVNAGTNAQNWNGNFTFTGTNTLSLGTGAVTMTDNVIATVSAQTLTVGGAIGDGAATFGLTKSGAGVLALNGANTYGGLTNLINGTLTLNGDNSAAAGGVSMAAGATLNLGHANALGSGTLTFNGGTLDNTSGGALTLGGNGGQIWNTGFTFTGTHNLVTGSGSVTLAANIPVDVSAGNLTVNGVIDDGVNSFNLEKTGAGTLTLGGSNTYGGATTLSQGTLVFAADQSLTTVNHALNFGASIGSTAVLAMELSGGSARFGGSMLVQTNNATANTITIGTGKTLQIDRTVTIGYNSGVNSTTKLNISGAGTFKVGDVGAPTNLSFLVGNGSTSTFSNAGTLDLSGLGIFYANLGSGTFRVGSATNTTGTAAAGSTVIMAANSTIFATTLTADSPDSGQVQAVKLGSGTNELNLNTINLGGNGRSSATMDFNGLTGTVKIRALDGAGRAAMNVGNGSFNTGAVPAGTVDFTGHSADLLLATLAVSGRSAFTTSNGLGTFSFDTGTLDATTVNIASRTGTTATSGSVTGTVNLGGGTVTIGTMTMGTNSVTTASSTGDAVSILNISAGTVSINALTMGVNTVDAGVANGSNTDATLNLTGGTTTVNTSFAMGAQNSAANAATTVNSALSTLNISAGSLTLAGSANLTMGATTLDANNVATATINITGTGSLTVGGNIQYTNGLGTETNTVTLDGGTLDLTGGNIGSASALITFNAQAGTLRNLAQLNGGGVLTKSTTGTLLLDTANAFTGGVSISATGGKIIVGHNNALGTGTITLAGQAATLELANGITVTNAMTVAASGNFKIIQLQSGATSATYSGNITNSEDVSANFDLITGVGGTLTVSGNISGNHALAGIEKLGVGTVILSGANSYTGTTTVSAGKLVVSSLGDGVAASSLGTAGLAPANLVFGTGTTLGYAGAGETSGRGFTMSSSATLEAAGTGALAFTSAAKVAFANSTVTRALTLDGTSTAANSFGAGLSVGGTLDADKINLVVKNGVGTWIIANGETLKSTALIDVNGGLLGLAGGVLPSAGRVDLATGTTLRMETGNTDDLGSRIQLDAGAAVTLAVSSDVSFATALTVAGAGSAAVTKSGAGKLTLAADNTAIAGGFTVAQGTLDVTNALGLGAANATVTGGRLAVNAVIANTVNVASGGTVGGAGTVATLNVANGATLSPGNSPGTLTAGNVALFSGSIFEWQVQDAADVAKYDHFNVTGTLDLSGASSANRIVFKVVSLLGAGDGTALGNPLNFDTAFSAAPAAQRIKTFSLGTVGSVNLGANANINDVFSFDVTQFTYSDGSTSNAGLWSIDWNSANGAITLTAVPEPSTYGFGLGALALAAAAIRRRRKNQPKV
jgi:autotransporter-associated beta strand protein